MNGDAAPMIREAMRTQEARFFGSATLPLFKDAGEGIAGACVPFVTAGDGNAPVILIELPLGEPAFTDSEQNLLLAFVNAACFQVPPSAPNPIVPCQKSVSLPAHDPEARRSRHSLKFLHAGLVGRSLAWLRALRELDVALDCGAHVFIQGPTGSGKELAARALVAEGFSADWPFIPINVRALTPTLLESELFGHEKGAFTGATRERRGLVEGSEKRVILLDEICSATLDFQEKILRFAQSGEFRRVGGNEILHARPRIVAATSRDVRLLMAKGTFLPDLYYRLAQEFVELPPLRDRVEDLPLLLRHLFGERAELLGPSTLSALAAHSWPGNVREFESVAGAILRRPALHDDAEGVRNFLARLPCAPPDAPIACGLALKNLKDLSDADKLRIIDARLRDNGGNIAALRAEAKYSEEGWTRRMIRLGKRPARRQKG